MHETPEQFAAEIDELRRQLAEAKEALEAIRRGDVDAIVVDRPSGPQVYALTGADQPYRIMLEEMQEGAVTLRDDAVVMYGNKQISNMLRISHQELVGVSFRAFLTPASLPLFDLLWQRSRDEPSRGEVTLAAADGAEVDALLAFNVLPSPELAQTSVVITDLTDQKRHQVALAAEAFARARAEELAEADRRKNEFLAMLAHELRNPLAPIYNGIDVLRILPLDTEQARQILDTMEQQTRNLVRLIDDLLDVSRVTRGKMELRRQRVPLAKIVANAIQTAEHLIRAKSHELTVTQTGENLFVYADPARLTQVVANLLNNAAKYTPSGGTILLTTERIANDAAIRVKDNGLGIAADMLPRIFDLFVQADNSLTRSQGGLGIGLTLVKSLMDMHGGTVEAASGGLGLGSEFTLKLPVLRASDLLPEPANDPTEQAGAFPSRRILVVDDLLPAARIVALMLESRGQQVRTACGGTEALAMIEREKPGLVLSDISMSDMTGYDLARAIRRRPEWNDIWLVAVTGYGQESDKRLAKEAGFNGHIVKPITKEYIERMLASLP